MAYSVRDAVKNKTSTAYSVRDAVKKKQQDEEQTVRDNALGQLLGNLANAAKKEESAKPALSSPVGNSFTASAQMV